jgi:DNA helicase-2/ATP-dependent DNA helicase PcrA
LKFIADFHIHSKFSRATSSQSVPEILDLWGKKKGITLLGTGDAVHPGWLSELKEKLESAEDGLFSLKKKYYHPETHLIKNGIDVRFILTAEISCIYKKDGRVRKVHNIIVAPSFGAIEKIAAQLVKIGNIVSDGRPILGLDSRDLLEIVLGADDYAFVIPAHIWTPWFSVLGSRSGFDSIEECYGDLSKHIFAVETGLSSDPPMNWLCSFLDKYSLVSNSDAHSPQNLGREANIFNTEITYHAVVKALKRENRGFVGTIEFFPEEGKYHFDGHRKCGICWAPWETRKNNGLCTVCGKAVTVGVSNRIEKLANRSSEIDWSLKREYFSLTPLKNILSEIYKVGPESKKVSLVYDQILRCAGSEFALLIDKTISEIQLIDTRLAASIEKLRNRNVSLVAGYDGVFGSVKVW